MAQIDAEIDRLYQLPPGEFIAARNALAKNAGKNGTDVRRLVKPSLPAWAVNQLYWKRRADYDALVEAAAALRKIHKSILGGHRGDIREATKTHDEAIDAALKSTLALVRGEGQPVTDATRQAILTTLRALPADGAPGRLTQALQPGGFEMLTGLSIAPVRQGKFGTTTALPPPKKPAAEKDKATAAGRGAKPKETAKRRQEAKEAAAKAARELRAAQHEAQREEFEAARAAREAEKAARALERAREAVEAAQKELEEAERNAREAGRTRDAAERRAQTAAAAVVRLRSD